MKQPHTKSTRRTFPGLAAAVLLIGWITAPAGATLIGDDVTLTHSNVALGIVFGPNTAIGSTTTTEWVNINSSVAPSGGVMSVDIVDDDTILITLTNNGSNIFSTGGWEFLFTDLDWGGAGTVAGIGATSVIGFVAPTFSIPTPTSVLVSGVSTASVLNPGATASISFDLIPSHAPPPPPPPNNGVPEPITATLGLMGLGVLGMATRRRVA